ncbi:MAG: SPASM domain-containing protein [Chloroflexia bacterium]
MPEIRVDPSGELRVPADWLARMGAAAGDRLLAEWKDGELSLYAARLDARVAYLEPTTRCNLNCAICVRQVAQDPLGEMDEETFRATLEGLRAFPHLERVVFAGFGEPLMHPRISEMLQRAASSGWQVVLATNGLLLDEACSHLLVRLRLHSLVVSLDTVHIQAYERAALDDGVGLLLSNLHRLRAIGEQEGYIPRIGLEFVLTRSNVHWLERLPTLAGEVRASFVLLSNLLPHTPGACSEILYNREEPLPLPSGWALPRGDFLLWGVVQTPRLKWGAHRHCRFVEGQALVVGWDGRVSPCYALMHSYPYFIYGRPKHVSRLVFGNVRERPLSEIWTDEAYVRFRAKVRAFRFPSCVDCGMACTYAEENQDCWGNDPSCADCLYAQDIVRCP